jgi:hypothetical protein
MAARSSKAEDSVTTEYLYSYHHFLSDYDNSEKRYFVSHRIIKKTAKRIFILDDDTERFFTPEKFAEHPEEFRTISFDRQKLELDGEVYYPRRSLAGHCYYTEQGKARFEAERLQRPVPPCLAMLGLSHGCTKEDIKRAFRRKSREVHPDHGGDSDSFIALREAYENALTAAVG